MQRLKTRDQFQAVLAGGIVARTAHFAMHCAALDVPGVPVPGTASSKTRSIALFATHEVWIGAMVPKRWARRAVTRNTVKRQIYSVGADFSSTLSPSAHVVRLRAGFERSMFTSASSELLKVAARQELQLLFTRTVARLATPPDQRSAA